MPTVYKGTQLGIPRRSETYRWYRRNYSVLNRDKKNWIGVEAKPPKDYPPFVLKTSERGETHYVPLWSKEKQGMPSRNYLNLK